MNVKINDFDGPFDLLWHLIKAKKMDIYDINIELITKEYLNYLSEHQDLTIDASSEYLVMASELIHLKSKMLLNKNDEEEEDIYEINSEDELRSRLLEYEKIKGLADNFRELEEKRKEVFTKIPSSLKEYADENTNVSYGVSLDDLLSAFEAFLARKKLEEPVSAAVTKRELSVEVCTRNIKKFLHGRGKVSFFELFETNFKPQIIVTFLSVLNLVKDREILISQDRNFGEIFIEESRGVNE